MDGTTRSSTAQGAAAERALLSGMGVLDDPFARTMLAPSMDRALWVAEHCPHWIWNRSVTLAGLAARVRWFDHQVLRASASAIEQIAVIGAGYDSRSWRMSADGVRFFEVDHAATQRDKIRRAPPAGPTYVESDLVAGDASTSLLAHGFDPSRPALFVVEGLTMYLDEAVVRRQLGLLAGTGAVGSRLAVDFFPPGHQGSPRHHRQLRLQQLARRGSGESFRLTLGRRQAAELVRASGWDVDEVTSLRDAAVALIPPGSGLPVAAVNEHKTLVAAVRVP